LERKSTIRVAIIAGSLTLGFIGAAHAYNVAPEYTFDPSTGQCIADAIARRDERAACSQDEATQHDVAMHLNQWLSRVSIDYGNKNLTPVQADRLQNPHRIPQQSFQSRHRDGQAKR